MNTAPVASITGTGPNGTVTLRPGNNVAGTWGITVTVSDGQASTVRSFTFSSRASANVLPTVSTIANQTIIEDGAITAQEMNQEIVKPTRTYANRQTLTVGGRTIELIHPGQNHSDDSTVIYFPAERVAFAVDFIFPGTTPGVWASYDGTPMSESFNYDPGFQTVNLPPAIVPNFRRTDTR